MRLKISHETVYRYGQPIRNLVQSLRLTPSVFEGQKTHEWQVDVSGGVKGPGFRDGAGDWIEGWTVRGPVDNVTVRISGRIDTRDTAGVLRGHREMIHPLTYLRDSPATRPDDALRDLAQSVEGTASGLVTVTMNGHGKVTALKLKPEAVDPDDVEALEDLLLVALQDASAKADALQQEATRGLGLPGF